MIRKSERILIALFMIITVLIHTVSAAEIPLPVSLLAGGTTGPLRIVISEPEVDKLSQFDESRTDQLNRLIRHIAVDITLDQELSRTGILIDRKEALSCLQRENAGNVEKIYSFEPTVIHSKSNGPEKADTDGIDAFLDRDLQKANQYLDEFYKLFAKAPEIFAERSKTEKTELYFSGFGKAVKRVTVSFPADYVQERFPEAIADTADTEDCKKLINGLVFSGSQKIGLLYDENGSIVRISYDGKVGQTQEELRKVALIWKCLREDDHLKDNISLKTPAVAGADKDNIAFERDLHTVDDDSGEFSWDMQIDHRAGKEDKKQTHFAADLVLKESVIKGSIEYSVKRDGKNLRIRIIPEIMKESGGEYKGTLEIADYSGKIDKNRFLVHIQIQEGDPVRWTESGPNNETAEKTGSAMKDINDERDEAENAAAAIIIQKLFELPEEDLKYFSNGIPESMWFDLIH